jgi:hypothetical protein
MPNIAKVVAKIFGLKNAINLIQQCSKSPKKQAFLQVFKNNEMRGWPARRPFALTENEPKNIPKKSVRPLFF